MKTFERAARREEKAVLGLGDFVSELPPQGLMESLLFSLVQKEWQASDAPIGPMARILQNMQESLLVETDRARNWMSEVESKGSTVLYHPMAEHMVLNAGQLTIRGWTDLGRASAVWLRPAERPMRVHWVWMQDTRLVADPYAISVQAVEYDDVERRLGRLTDVKVSRRRWL